MACTWSLRAVLESPGESAYGAANPTRRGTTSNSVELRTFVFRQQRDAPSLPGNARKVMREALDDGAVLGLGATQLAQL